METYVMIVERVCGGLCAQAFGCAKAWCSFFEGTFAQAPHHNTPRVHVPI